MTAIQQMTDSEYIPAINNIPYIKQMIHIYQNSPPPFLSTTQKYPPRSR